MKRSLKARLLGWTIGGMALVLAVFAGVVYVTFHRALTDSFDGSLAATARALAAAIKQEGNKINVEFDDQDMSEFRKPRHPEYFEVWDGTGAVLNRSASLGGSDLGRFEAPVGKPVFQTLALPDGRPGRAVVLVFLPRMEDEDGEDGEKDEARQAKRDAAVPRPVTLVVARETARLDADLARLGWLLAGAAAGTVLLTLLVAALVVRQGLRPLDALAVQIAAIREDNLSATIPADRMPAEMAPIVERLNELLRRLEEAFRRERALTADVAHELRTPLAGMRSTIEVALSRVRQPVEYQQALRDSLDIVRRTQAMVDNLLTLARLEGGQTTLRPEVVRLAELVEACWQPMAEKAQARGIAYAGRLPADLACTADRDSLALVLSNVLANAAEYADDGGRIEVAGTRTGDAVALEVSNTGCRLLDAEVAHVFDRFWRGDSSRTDTGDHCGLGLALVRRTMAALGGAVSVRAAGGVFTLRLVLPAADPGRPI